MGQKIDGFVLQYADFIIKWRFAVIAATVLVAVIAGSGMGSLGFSSNYRAFFGPDNPELQAFESFQNTYSKNDNIMFVVQPDDKDITTVEVAQAIEAITKASWQIPYAIRVDSVSNFQYSYADEEGLIVEDLILDAAEMGADVLDTRWDVAAAEPQIYGSLLALDREASGINVTLQYPELSVEEAPAAVAKAREILAEVKAQYPDMTIVISGVSMMNNAFFEAGMKDTMTLTPIMYLILIVVMIFALRSLAGTISTVFVIGFSVVITMGWTGHMGIFLTPISVTAPTIVLTLAIADSVHILVSMLTNMRDGMNKIEALRDSIRLNFMPVAITSVTTIIGFLSLNSLDSPPFHDLGNMTAVGILAAWVLSMTFLPAFMSLLPVKVKARKKASMLQRFLNRYARWVVVQRRPVLFVSTLAAVVLIAMVPKIELNDQWVEYFDHSIEFRGDAEFAMEELTGVYLIEYSVAAADAGGVSDPVYLQNLDAFTVWLRAQPEVSHVFSYTDIIKRLNKNLNADDEAFYKVPAARDIAAQYHLLFELSLPYGLDMNDRVDIDKAATRVTATLGDLSTTDTRAFLDRSEAWLRDNTPPYMHATATGPTVMFSHLSERNIIGMLKGNSVAIVLISVLLMFALRSVSMGFLSFIPNAVPILMTFGLWAVVFGNIGMAASGVSAVALGIVVDDTVHFLSKYLRARREKGMDKPEAVHYAYSTVGIALIVTTFILTLGFMVMSMSSFQVNEQLGLMTAATMVIALVMDFTLLPAMLLIGHKDKQVNEVKG